MKRTLLLTLVALCGTDLAYSQNPTITSTTEVDFQNGAATLLRNNAGVALSQGVAATNNDGTLIQLGYFSMGTTANNFAGTFIPLTGAGLLPTTIGDSADNSGAGDGRLAFTTVFRGTTNAVLVFDPLAGDTGTYMTQSSVTITGTTPPTGQVLAIRFFDSVAGTSGFYNTVSADNWLWLTPTDAGSNVLLNLVTAGINGNPALEFQDAANPFRTSILVAIPEPSTLTLFAIGGGLVMLLGFRRTLTTA